VVQERLHVLVVDDDFMIARVHAKYIESQQGYKVIGVAYNYEETLTKIIEFRPDLVILDVYLPDGSGIDLLRTVRARRIPCDVILITAAKELDVVEEGFRLGAFDYLIKPFDLDHLRDSLIKYKQYKERLSKSASLDQKVVDDLRKMRSSAGKPVQSGIDFRTLERIKASLLRHNGFQSSEEIARSAGVSRSTVQKYLAYLVEEKVAEEKLLYGTVGRPQILYRPKV